VGGLYHWIIHFSSSAGGSLSCPVGYTPAPVIAFPPNSAQITHRQRNPHAGSFWLYLEVWGGSQGQALLSLAVRGGGPCG